VYVSRGVVDRNRLVEQHRPGGEPVTQREEVHPDWRRRIDPRLHILGVENGGLQQTESHEHDGVFAEGSQTGSLLLVNELIICSRISPLWAASRSSFSPDPVRKSSE